jgi:superoxide dismutase, Cu-Zn family
MILIIDHKKEMPMRSPITLITISVLSMAAAACIPAAKPPVSANEKPVNGIVAPTSGPTVVAAMQNKDGAELGSAGITPGKNGVQLDIDVTGLAIGSYGVHLHAIGKCDGPDFKTAGAHWNPAGKQHGRENPMGAHLGDLPNLVVTTANKGKLSVALPGLNINGDAGLLDADGTSIIIHAMADDYRTDPSGNSGARMICGVFRQLYF